MPTKHSLPFSTYLLWLLVLNYIPVERNTRKWSNTRYFIGGHKQFEQVNLRGLTQYNHGLTRITDNVLLAPLNFTLVGGRKEGVDDSVRWAIGLRGEMVGLTCCPDPQLYIKMKHIIIWISRDYFGISRNVGGGCHGHLLQLATLCLSDVALNVSHMAR